MTIKDYGERPNVKTLEIYGLSNETKPTDTIDGIDIKTGSCFIEMDTSTIYIYSEVGKKWYEL